MGAKSSIEWTEASWNPTYGCTKVSPACANCYIVTQPPYRVRGLKWENGAIPVQLFEDRLRLPLTWKRGRRIFVDSLADLFHEDVPAWFIAKVYAVMLAAHWHTFQVLTKRPERRRALLTNTYFLGAVMDEYRQLQEKGLAAHAPLPPSNGASLFANVWEGCTVENQHWAGIRVHELLSTPAAIHFLSIEPLLGPIMLGELQTPAGTAFPLVAGGYISDPERPLDLTFYGDRYGASKLDWVIVGGESGPQVRGSQATPSGAARALVEPCVGEVLTNRAWHAGEDCNVCDGSGWVEKRRAVAWVRSLRDQCVAAGVAFHFKQWGGRKHDSAGRELDGRTWDELPNVLAPTLVMS